MITKHNVLFYPAAAAERATLEVRERVAVDNAVEKLRTIGEQPEYLTLSVADRAALIAWLLPSTRPEALSLAMAAVDARTG